jgi:uncharacterized membrane protein HdeD (DUF308 family)
MTRDPQATSAARPARRQAGAPPSAVKTRTALAKSRDLWKPTLLSGALAVILGGWILLWPNISIEAVAILQGVYLVSSAAMQVIIGFSMGEATRGQALLFVNGATSLVLGILAFRHISNAVQLLAIAVGVPLLFRGMATMVYGISDSDANDGGWTILFGTVTAVAGVMLMALPLTSVATLATVVGFCLVVLGVLEIISSYEIRVSEIEFRR